RLGVFHLNNFPGNPIDPAIAAAHLIFGGGFDRHPKLQVNLQQDLNLSSEQRKMILGTTAAKP
ncbi:MAG: hypothetical protein J2P51_13095, partial [Hyphomicrobiaceae bacterium]|nr:hypothetical protein [Hyphomicrobiaceae bacterium]